MELINYKDILGDYFFSKTLRPATEWSYRKVIHSFMRYTGENIFPEQIDRQIVLNWRRHVLSEQQLSTRTWNNKVAYMRAIFNHAVAQEFFKLKDNPFNGVIARSDAKRKKILSDAEIQKIYLLMEERELQERVGIIGKKRCALRPAWFWLTVVDT